MKFALPVLLALLLAPTVVLAGGFRGVAALAALSPTFPCDRVLALLDPVPFPALSVVWGTFGDDPTCIQTFLDRYRDRPHLLQIHFSNETCRPDHTCLDGEFRPDLSANYYNLYLTNYPWVLAYDLDQRMRAIRAAIDPYRNENTTLVLSLGLEDRLTTTAAAALKGYLRGYWPWFISRNPVNGRSASPTEPIAEFHDPTKSLKGFSCIFSEDGNLSDTARSATLLAKYRNCFLVLLWRRSWQNNGAASCPTCGPAPHRTFIPPKKRKFSVSSRDIIQLSRVLRKAP